MLLSVKNDKKSCSSNSFSPRPLLPPSCKGETAAALSFQSAAAEEDRVFYGHRSVREGRHPPSRLRPCDSVRAGTHQDGPLQVGVDAAEHELPHDGGDGGEDQRAAQDPRGRHVVRQGAGLRRDARNRAADPCRDARVGGRQRERDAGGLLRTCTRAAGVSSLTSGVSVCLFVSGEMTTNQGRPAWRMSRWRCVNEAPHHTQRCCCVTSSLRPVSQTAFGSLAVASLTHRWDQHNNNIDNLLP